MGEHRWSAVLFALAWPGPVFLGVGPPLVVVNEHLLHAHVFPAARVAGLAALAATLAAAWWAERLPHG